MVLQNGRNKQSNGDNGDTRDDNDGVHPTPAPPKGINRVGGIAQRKQLPRGPTQTKTGGPKLSDHAHPSADKGNDDVHSLTKTAMTKVKTRKRCAIGPDPTPGDAKSHARPQTTPSPPNPTLCNARLPRAGAHEENAENGDGDSPFPRSSLCTKELRKPSTRALAPSTPLSLGSWCLKTQRTKRGDENLE